MLWANYHSGTPQKDNTEEITMNNQNRNQNNNQNNSQNNNQNSKQNRTEQNKNCR